MIPDSTTSAITTVQLRRLIKEIYEHSPQTKIRFRLIGKMWESRFLNIVHVTPGDSLVVQDDETEQMKNVPLGDVVAFEIETKFQDFHPHNHYRVDFQQKDD